jgi:hypothetical protein
MEDEKYFQQKLSEQIPMMGGTTVEEHESNFKRIVMFKDH